MGIAEYIGDQYDEGTRDFIQLYTAKKVPSRMKGKKAVKIPFTGLQAHLPSTTLRLDPTAEATAIRDYLELRGIQVAGIQLQPEATHFVVYGHTQKDATKIAKLCPINNNFVSWLSAVWLKQPAIDADTEDDSEEDDFNYSSESE